MRRLPLLALPIALAAAPAAHAADLKTDRACYLERESTQVGLIGSGFLPQAPYDVLLDGQALLGGSSTIGADGTMTGTLRPPPLAADEAERTFEVGVRSGGATATTSFTLTKLLADFSPSAGNPRTLRVRFSLHGFALRDETDPAGVAEPDVFVHYLRPNGRLRRTIRLGRVHGPCGTIARTAKRRLFPFAAERGTWRLQFDTNRAFRRGTASSPFLFYTVGVRIRKAA